MSSKKRKKATVEDRLSMASQLIEKTPDQNENCDLNLEAFETRELCDGHDPYGVYAVEAIQRARALRTDQSSTSSLIGDTFHLEESLKNYRLKFPIIRSADEIKVDSRPAISAAETIKLAKNAGKIEAFVIGFDALEPTASQKLADTICWQLDRTAHELTVMMKRGQCDTPDAKFALIQHILQTNRLTVDQMHEFYRMKWRRRCEKLAARELANPHSSQSTVVDSSDETALQIEQAGDQTLSQSIGMPSGLKRRLLTAVKDRIHL